MSHTGKPGHSGGIERKPKTALQGNETGEAGQESKKKEKKKKSKNETHLDVETVLIARPSETWKATTNSSTANVGASCDLQDDLAVLNSPTNPGAMSVPQVQQ